MLKSLISIYKNKDLMRNLPVEKQITVVLLYLLLEKHPQKEGVNI